MLDWKHRKAGLLESYGKRGSYRITEVGKQLLSENPAEIDVRHLRRYESYRNFVHEEGRTIVAPLPQSLKDTDKTPEEIMGTLAAQLDLQLADELLESICHNSPTFFEALGVDLLLKMGYGGLEGSGAVTKKTGDGGIDGVIKQDELGLDMIYVQEQNIPTALR